MEGKKFLFILWLIYLAFSIQIIYCQEDDDTQDDWLHVEDCKIVDKNGNEVWLTGVNWFGYNTGSDVFDGVWSRNLHEMLTEIADHGFNLLRVPVSTQILLHWKNGDILANPMVNVYENEELCDEGRKVWDSFRIWTQVMAWCKELGIKIMIDIHSAATSANGHTMPLWYSGGITTDDWIEALEWVADYYKNDDTIIALDLKNEPHGKADDGDFAKWDGSTDKNNWKYAAETCALRVLEKNPNLLIVIEGIEIYPKEFADWTYPSVEWVTYTFNYYNAWWGGNFRGAREYPITYKIGKTDTKNGIKGAMGIQLLENAYARTRCKNVKDTNNVILDKINKLKEEDRKIKVDFDTVDLECNNKLKNFKFIEERNAMLESENEKLKNKIEKYIKPLSFTYTYAQK